MPELILKDQKDIALEITITNFPSGATEPFRAGDDAHEAKLIATFPNALTYSAFRELRAFPVSVWETLQKGKPAPVLREHKVTQCALLFQEKQLSCVANQNGSQVNCELGNPFKRNSSVGDAIPDHFLLSWVASLRWGTWPMLKTVSIFLGYFLFDFKYNWSHLRHPGSGY